MGVSPVNDWAVWGSLARDCKAAKSCSLRSAVCTNAANLHAVPRVSCHI